MRGETPLKHPHYLTEGDDDGRCEEGVNTPEEGDIHISIDMVACTRGTSVQATISIEI